MSPIPRSQRRPTRLKTYDYSSSGAYFVTVCTHQRECLLGDALNGEFRPSSYGVIVQQVWQALPQHYPSIVLDAFVVMPNHLHGIIALNDAVGEGLRPSPTLKNLASLSTIVGSLKSFSARRINEARGVSGIAVWQRGFYEHIVRSKQALNRVREYILKNPANWASDVDNPIQLNISRHSNNLPKT